jgi:hypothetical protein
MARTEKPPDMWQLRDDDGNVVAEVGETDEGDTEVHLLDEDYTIMSGWPGT